MSFYYSNQRYPAYPSTAVAYPVYPIYPISPVVYPAYDEYYPIPISPSFLRRIPDVLLIVQRPVNASMDLVHTNDAKNTKNSDIPHRVKDDENIIPEESLNSLDSLSMSKSSSIDMCDVSEIHEISEANRKMFDIVDYIGMDENNSHVYNKDDNISDCQSTTEDAQAWDSYFEYDYVPKKNIWNYACMVSTIDIETGLKQTSCAYDNTDFDRVVCPDSRIMYASA
jgi:hypothetical protein